jgi:hypothetical protein
VLQRRELDAIDLRDAVHQLGHGLAEALGDLALGGGGVLDRVVQQRRHQGLRVEVPLGEDLGDGERVRDVRLAALAILARVRGARDLVGLLDVLDVPRLEVAEEGRQLLGPGSGQGGSGGLEATGNPRMDAERRQGV